MSERDVFDSLALCSHDVPGGRYWALDPIDGTKGFLRGDQYAIALALIDDGDVVLGVLGCPNLANSDGSTGATFVAVPGRCRVHAGTRTTVARVAVPATLADRGWSSRSSLGTRTTAKHH